MENELEYFVENSENVLFAHGEVYNFFKVYNNVARKWETSRISYSQFLHDCEFHGVSREEAGKITGEVFPDEEYQEYCQMFAKGN